ncbi:hypothetical protein M409DRAFT_63740 [Zasmidium cellare ATCC 36951]|uniref:Cytochrome P450 n=1 Tax=Zasmidium cellare ATCC 36951 TaxID=1080233 RepID=A0A6A6CWI3_ZASCE|nr:uncharacterized protein M409DRAFT_63740 [Zasmidium cellare ATCC 36951]KAF2171494.1 hypothetical protein M409DRAFT_63740 [Zasmidium cellare ATCC 36951]
MMMSLLFMWQSSLLAVGIYFICKLYKIITSPLTSIPGPWYTHFTNLILRYHTLTGQRIFYIHSLHHRHGPIVRISPNEVDVSDLAAFAEVHRIGSGFTKSEWYDRATYGIQGNVFVMTDVKAHAERRRLLARPFSKSSLVANFHGVVGERARRAVGEIRREVVGGTGEADVMKWWTLMATDVVARVVFGEELGLVEAGEKTDYINDLELATQAWGLRGEEPLLYHVMRLVAPQTIRHFDTSIKNVVTYGTAAAARAKHRDLQKQNVLNEMISLSKEGKSNLTDSAIGAQASALIVAGSGTTAVTLTYAVWAIVKHPQVRAKLEEEVSKIPADYNDATLESLPYLKAVITEVLRLYGSAPGSLPRRTPEGGIAVTGYFVPAGVTVTTQIYTIHRDAEIFPDPDKFDPSRFYNRSLSADERRALAPFGGGTRLCLGIHLAEMELRHGLAEFFRECRDVELSGWTTPESMEMDNYFLIIPKSKRCLVRRKDEKNM